MFILFALLPLAVSAGCDVTKIADCAKCGVGPIGNQFDGHRDGATRDVCNCNGKKGEFPKMCPKTGSPEAPTCCNVDGKTANVQSCKCGTATCQSDQVCTASTNTCAYPVCSNTDGSKILGDMKGGSCQCGKHYECSAGQKCNAAKSDSTACEYPVCSTVDGSAVATNTKCKCGVITCRSEGDTCTASSNTCKPKSTPTVTPKELPRCKVDVVITEKCMCQKGSSGSSANQASVGQTCPKDSNDPVWPACKGGDVFATLNQKCKCADRDTCGYGSKCTQSGTYKGRCECVPGKNVGCVEVVQPKGTCPLSCDDHTTMDATPVVFDECVAFFGDIYAKYSMKNDKVTAVYYSDNCKTVADMSAFGMKNEAIAGGCSDDFKNYITLPHSAKGSSGTALQITTPALFVVGLLAFVLL